MSQRDGTVVLTLAATAQPGMCIQVLAEFEYRARIYGLNAGPHTVDVVATYPGTGWTSRTDRIEVQIP